MRMRPYLTWGDRRHFELHVGRFAIERWCPGAPCHLPGVADRPHVPRVVIYRRTGSARSLIT
jgi:hypothetical protein